MTTLHMTSVNDNIDPNTAVIDDKTLARLMLGQTPEVQDALLKIVSCATTLKQANRKLPGRISTNGRTILRTREFARIAGIPVTLMTTSAAKAVLALLEEAVGLESAFRLAEGLSRLKIWERSLADTGEKVPCRANGKPIAKHCCQAAGFVSAGSPLCRHPAVLAELRGMAERVGSRYQSHSKANNVVLDRLRAWENSHVKGRGVPAHPLRPDRPYFNEIAQEANVAACSLHQTAPSLLLREIIARYGLFIVTEKNLPYLVQRRLCRYRDRLRRLGRGLPSLRAYPDRRDLARIAEESGVQPSTLDRDRYQALLDTFQSEIGLSAVSADTPLLEPIKTVAWLIGECVEVLQEPGTKPRKNFGAAMKRWSATVGHDSPARETLEASLREMPSCRDRSELQFAREVLDTAERNGLPPGFCKAFRVALWNEGITASALARCVGVKQVNSWSWRQPGVQYVSTVRKVEAELDLPPDTLVSRMNFRQQIDNRLTDPSYKPPSIIRTLVMQNLSEEDRQAERAHLLAKRDALTEHFISTRTRTSRLVSMTGRNPFKLKAWPPHLDEAFAAMVRAKMEEQRTGETLRSGETRWSAATAMKYRGELGRFFGYLTRPDGDRRAVAREALSFGYLVWPDLVTAFVRWSRERSRLPEDERLPPAGSGTLSLLGLCRALFRSSTGLLRQQPKMLDGLDPIPGFVEMADIEAARADWEGTCDRAAKQYHDLKAELKAGRRYAPLPSENFLKIGKILSSHRPEQYLVALINRQRELRRTLQPNSVVWAAAVRDEAYLCIQAQLCLRVGTLAKMNHEHFTDRGDEIWLDLPRVFFKNRHAKSVWCRGGKVWINYRERLRDRHGTYETLRLWRDVASKLITPPGETAYFVGSARGQRFTPCRFQDVCRRLTAQHLCYNAMTGRGDPEQIPFHNQCFRHIVATQVWLATRDWRAVARVLRDTVPIARSTYASVVEHDLLDQDLDPLDFLMAA